MASSEVCEEIYEALLQCAICRNRLNEPKVLPLCSHVFCRNCLVQLLSSSGRVVCPLCRTDNTSDIPGGNIDRLTEGHFIVRLNDIVSRHRQAPRGNSRLVRLSSTNRRRRRNANNTAAVTNASQMKCPVCSMVFQDLALLQSHVEICLNDKSGRYFSCPQCDNVYLTDDIFTIQAHLVECMPDISLVAAGLNGVPARGDTANHGDCFVCPSCDAILDNMASMETHVATHHDHQPGASAANEPCDNNEAAHRYNGLRQQVGQGMSNNPVTTPSGQIEQPYTYAHSSNTYASILSNSTDSLGYIPPPTTPDDINVAVGTPRHNQAASTPATNTGGQAHPGNGSGSQPQQQPRRRRKCTIL